MKCFLFLFITMIWLINDNQLDSMLFIGCMFSALCQIFLAQVVLSLICVCWQIQVSVSAWVIFF